MQNYYNSHLRLNYPLHDYFRPGKEKTQIFRKIHKKQWTIWQWKKKEGANGGPKQIATSLMSMLLARDTKQLDLSYQPPYCFYCN